MASKKFHPVKVIVAAFMVFWMYMVYSIGNAVSGLTPFPFNIIPYIMMGIGAILCGFCMISDIEEDDENQSHLPSDNRNDHMAAQS